MHIRENELNESWKRGREFDQRHRLPTDDPRIDAGFDRLIDNEIKQVPAYLLQDFLRDMAKDGILCMGRASVPIFLKCKFRHRSWAITTLDMYTTDSMLS